MALYDLREMRKEAFAEGKNAHMRLCCYVEIKLFSRKYGILSNYVSLLERIEMHFLLFTVDKLNINCAIDYEY